MPTIEVDFPKDQSLADELSDALDSISSALSKRKLPLNQISQTYGDFYSHINDLIEDFEED